MSLRRLWAIIKKEFIQIIRDKPSLGMGFMAPILMLLLFGYAVNTDVDHIKMTVLDMDNTELSRSVISSFENSNYFVVDSHVASMDELKHQIDSGRAKAGLVLKSNFQSDIRKNAKTELLFVVDGSDPAIARTAYSSGLFVAQAYSSNLKLQALSRTPAATAARLEPFDVKGRIWYNPEGKATHFTIPGLIGLIMQNITVMLTAFALVRERERGTIEQLIVTPVRRSELILGKLVPYIGIGFLDLVVATLLGTWWFGIPIAGSLPLLFLLGAGFVICALAMGILISTIAKNQLQAMQAAIIIILPSVLLSGFMFPREAMPAFVSALGGLFPITYFLVILRSIIVKGAGLSLILNDVIILLVVGTCLLVLSILRFRKKLD